MFGEPEIDWLFARLAPQVARPIGGVMARRKEAPAMNPKTLSQLVDIVTDPAKATESLSDENRRAYEEAQRSVVEARFSAEAHQEHVRIL